jgi:hypothetical protein
MFAQLSAAPVSLVVIKATSLASSDDILGFSFPNFLAAARNFEAGYSRV